MTGTMKALVWKEWQQVSWKAWYASIVVGLFVMIGLKGRVFSETVILSYARIFCELLVPMFIAMTIVAGEREDGVASFGTVLPVEVWELYKSKVIAGVIAVGIPVVILHVIVWAYIGSDSLWAFILDGFMIFVYSTAIFIWDVVFSIRSKHEIAVVGWHSLLIFIFLIFLVLIVYYTSGQLNHSLSIVYLSLFPFGLMAGNFSSYYYTIVMFQALVCGILIYVGFRRFERFIGEGRSCRF